MNHRDEAGADRYDTLETWSVVEVHRTLQRAFATMNTVIVSGTITGTKVHKTITAAQLVTYQGSQPVASLNIVLGEPHRTRIAHQLGTPITDGIELSLVGRLETRPDWGQLRLNVIDVIGAAAPAQITLDRTQLQATYETNGGFSAQQRLAAPRLPIRVGANNSAAQADIRRVLSGRQVPVQLTEAAIYTTGDGAPERVASTIARLATKQLELIIVARGGGGRAELDTFDSEEVIRAIAQSRTPIWTAIGHASDATLADRAAQQSFPTPTAAAEELARLHTLHQSTQREQQQQQVAAHHLENAQRQMNTANTRNAQLIGALIVAVIVVLYLLTR
jgi:exodeoxyribonuclease VII large subunit